MQKIFCLKHGIIWGVQMKTINWENALYVILILAAFMTIINWFFSGKTLSIKFVIDSKSLSVTCISIVCALFCTVFWKAPIFKKWLVLIPDLNGKWDGSIESDWINPETNEVVAPIKTEIMIKQSLFKISCVMKTGDMRSDSISADFNIDDANQKYQLVYIYMSVPKQNKQAGSPIHYGSMMFDFEDNYNVEQMSGNYWTGRKTCGHISVEKFK